MTSPVLIAARPRVEDGVNQADTSRPVVGPEKDQRVIDVMRQS